MMRKQDGRLASPDVPNPKFHHPTGSILLI